MIGSFKPHPFSTAAQKKITPAGRITMGIEGIGARVARKEDKRFITGKGRYVDDIRLHGMTYAAFVRSPHAHAKVKGID